MKRIYLIQLRLSVDSIAKRAEQSRHGPSAEALKAAETVDNNCYLTESHFRKCRCAY
jgi:hypothetical protein